MRIEEGGIVVFGDADENTLAQARDVATRAERVALMADNHVGYVMPIGGVAAYRDKVSVVGVGFDIACGNAAIRTDLSLHDLGGTEAEVGVRLNQIADEIHSTVSFGIGRKNRADDAPVDDPLFMDPAWHAVPRDSRKDLKQKARGQLGTVGSGNHYVDVFSDEAGALWVGVHFGSRGFGHTVASGFLALGQNRRWGERVPEQEVLLGLDQPIGHDYWHLMELAGRYAYAGREWVARKVVSILGGRELELVHNHHNFCIPGDQTIPSPLGPIRMSDLEAGDKVYAFDSGAGLVETKVMRKWRSGTKPILTVRTRGRELRVSLDHPVQVIEFTEVQHPTRPWLSCKAGELRWRQADQLRVGDILVCAHSYYSRSEAIGEDRARLVGAFLGDGWVRGRAGVARSGYSVGLAIGGPGEDHVPRYMAVLGAALPGASWHDNAPGAYGLTCSAKGVWQELARLGLNLHSRERSVPDYAFLLPRHEKLALLAGYMDADGSVAGDNTSNHGRGKLASVSRELVVGLRELAIGAGLQVTPVRSSRRVTNFGPCVVHSCTLAADSVAELDIWHPDKARNRRRTKFLRSQGLSAGALGHLSLPQGTFAQRITELSLSPPEEVFDISIAHESHAFVCNGVVVHNCWKEEHSVGDRQEELIVIRKGATPAFPGQKGFIGGSMGDDAVIVQGAPHPDEETAEMQKAALFSTVHGAGRVMSRTQAAGKRNWKTGAIKSPGLVSPEMMREWVDRKGVVLRGGGLDESPHVYRRLPDVLAAQGSTIEVLHTLRPLIVVMAGQDERDPYRD
jgi:RNA-splicing ligase RtcB